MKPSLRRVFDLSLRARVVIAVLLAAALAGGVMLAWAVQAQRRAAIAQARDFAESVHQLTIAGLTGMMITGTGAQRGVFLEQIEQANSIRSLRVVRGPAVAAQYGRGVASEQPVDALESRVIAEGDPVYDVLGRGDTEFLRAVMPVIASRNYLGKNCLGCHSVPEGTTLGALTLEVELARNKAFVAEFQQGMAAVGVLLFVPLGVLAWLAVTGSVTLPLRRLSWNLDEIARGDANLKLRLAPDGSEELAQAAHSFNRVLEKAAEMLRSERIASDVFDHALEGILVADRDARIVKVNRAFTRTTGFSAEEAIGRNPSLLQSGRHDARFYQTFWDALRTRGEWQGEIWNRRKNGEVYPEWLNVSTVRDAAGEIEHFVAIFSDITERKRQEALIEYQAYHDALTGLPNRTLFRDRLEQTLSIARRNGTEAAVMFLDLDRFKFINDSLGHRAGDLLLKEVARRVRAAVREADTVARLGGDEFTVLLPEVAGVAGAEAVAAKIVEATREPYKLGDKDLTVTTSVGIALYPRDGRNADSLMKNADTAMYHVKEQGRAGFKMYDAEMSARARRHLEMEAELRKALELGQLDVLYQPQVHLGSGALCGVEALLRWNHPRLGLLAAREFIDLAEETGYMVPIGRFVLGTACREAARWDGPDAPIVSVPLSPRQFKDGELVDDVERALAASALAPERLELQVSEGLAMLDVERSIAVLGRLAALGVRLAICEFGVGFNSSVHDLRRMPVHSVRIDRGLVRDLAQNPQNAGIVAGVIGMARDPRLAVTAVGVETREQLDHLRLMRCDSAQGDYLACPVSAAEVAALRAARRDATACQG